MVLAILILSALSLIALVVLIILVLQQRTADRYEDILDKLSDQRRELNDAVHSALSGFGQLMDNGQRSFARQQNDNQQSFQQSVELRDGLKVAGFTVKISSGTSTSPFCRGTWLRLTGIYRRRVCKRTWAI